MFESSNLNIKNDVSFKDFKILNNNKNVVVSILYFIPLWDKHIDRWPAHQLVLEDQISGGTVRPWVHGLLRTLRQSEVCDAQWRRVAVFAGFFRWGIRWQEIQWYPVLVTGSALRPLTPEEVTRLAPEYMWRYVVGLLRFLFFLIVLLKNVKATI